MAWPVLPLRAGWAGLVFAADESGFSWFLGALWAPVQCGADSPGYLGASRPTSPVAELSAIVACMTMLRAVACDAGVFWFTDSEYAHGVVIAGSTAQSELTLVQRARCEAGWRRRFALLHGRTYPGHIRFPPKMKQPDLCPAVPTLSLDHALYWTQIDTILDPLNYSSVHSNAKSRDIVHLHVATANVLTLYRLDRAYESMEASLHIIGIQEPRERDPFPWNVADYVVFASRATDRGAGGCELWIRKAQISDLKECQVLLAQPRRLLVKLSCCFGVLRCVVLHGLDGSS